MEERLGTLEQPSQSKLEQILLYAYFISQGSPYLQKRLFQYLHNTNPHWKISDDQKKDLKESVKRKAKVLQDSGVHQYMESLETETDITLNEMQEIFAGRYFNPTATDLILYEIAHVILVADNHHLKENGGRIRKSEVSNKRKDSFWLKADLRHFDYFILEKHQTGVAEFDQMFEGIRNLKNFDNMLSDFQKSLAEIA